MKVLEKDSEERLLIAAAQRDPARFAELYEANFARVYAYVAHRVGNREEAQDLTSEVFHQALSGLHGYHWRGVPFVAWLLGIAAHVLAERWQRVGRHAEVPADELELAGVDPKIEQSAMLFQLVQALPEDQRHVIVRRFVNQRSLREIATEMGRSEGAIKQLQLRALEKLRDLMRSED